MSRLGNLIPEGTNDVNGVHKWVADSREFPIQDGYYTGLSRVKDLKTVISIKPVLRADIPTYNIVKFKVSVHDGIAVTWKVLSHVINNFVVVLVSTSKFFPSCSIFDFRLLSFNAAKGVAMSSIEVRLFSISCQTNGIRV